MIRRAPRSLSVLAVAALALLAAGCGDDEDDAAAASPETTEAAAATETTEAAAAETAATTPATEAAPTTDDPTADWPDTLVLGAVPSEESTALQESYSNIIRVLEEELGVEVEFFQATDYAGIIEAQIAGKVDLAQYGPFSYVLAKNNGANIDPVGAIVDGPDEEPGYQSYGITRADNAEIDELADFAGRSVCFVDPASTSGFLYPSAGLLELGIDPETGVTPIFAGGHDASAISVVNGDCEAGFAFDAMVDTQLIEDGAIQAGDLKTVWKSETIAGSPLAMSLDLPESMQEEIRRLILEEANSDALLAAGRCDSEENCGITDENAWGYVLVEDSFYDGVRAVCDATKSERCD